MTGRWSPGKGWRKLADGGHTAVWMRAEPDGVGIAVYTGHGFGYRDDDMAEIWIAKAPTGSSLPYHVLDKPRRIRWALGEEWMGHVTVHRCVPPSHAGHRRHRRRRSVWRTTLPRRIEAALGPPRTPYPFDALLVHR